MSFVFCVCFCLTQVLSYHNGFYLVTPESDTIHVAFIFDHESSDLSRNHDSNSFYSELDSKIGGFYSSLNHNLAAEKCEKC